MFKYLKQFFFGKEVPESRYKILRQEEYVENGIWHYNIEGLGRIISDNKQWTNWLFTQGYTDQDGYCQKPLDNIAFAKLKELNESCNLS